MSTFVTLLEAATFLGVSKATLRNWDREGKLSASRNKANGYRMYNLDELLAIKNSHQHHNNSSDNLIIHKLIDRRTIKKSITKIQSIIRDSDANSNIITRFDEISKLLFLKLYVENPNNSLFSEELFEQKEHYFNRIQNSYKEAIIDAKISVPPSFQNINLSPETVYKCGLELEMFDTSNVAVDIKGLAYEDTIRNTFDKSDNQQFFTPYQIVNFMVEIMSKYISGNVCDPACGTAGFLTKVCKDFPETMIYGFEVDERLSWVSSLNLLIHHCNHFSIEFMRDGGSLGNGANKYLGTMDAIITNPPFGSDYTDPEILNHFELGKGKSSRRRGILFIEQAWNLLKDGGVVAIIIDQSVLNSSSCIDVRRFIISHFELLAVIELPETAFMPYASVNASILVMKKTIIPPQQRSVFYAKSNKIGRKSNGDDDYVYSSDGNEKLNSDLNIILEQWKQYEKGDNNINYTQECFIADFTEIDQNSNDDFRIDFAFQHPYRKDSKSSLEKSNYTLYSLAELCEERNESYIPATDSDCNLIPFTGLANIESYTGKAIQVTTPTASIKSAVKRYEQGDIIFAKMRPNLRKIALMQFSEGGYVSSECAVYTVREDQYGNKLIDPRLLVAILRSDFVFGQIMGFITGIGRPRISNKDLRKIKIPLPPIEIQNKALSALDSAVLSSNQLKDKASMLLQEADQIEHTALNYVASIIAGEK